jgi:uncharacterized protein (TIGR03067 family)
MKPLLTMLAALCAAALCAADRQREAKTDHDLIQGKWKVVSVKESGRSPRVPDDLRVVITADTISIEQGNDDPIGMKYQLHPSERPKAMDVTHEIMPGKPIRQLAIYALRGDELELCLEAAGKPRPTGFESAAGDTTVVWVLGRAK